MFTTDVRAIIEEAVCEKQCGLIETKQSIFQNLPNGESPHAADVKLIENYFIKILIDCARIEFEKTFQNLCIDKNFVDKFTHCSDQISTITDLLGLCEVGVYAAQLKLHSNLIDEFHLASFITNLKIYTWNTVLEKSTVDHTEIQVLQRLVACFQANIISQSMYTKLKEFKDNCESQSSSAYYLKKLMNDEEVEENSAGKLRAFLQSVKSLTCEHLFFKSQLLQLIGLYLKPIEIKIQTMGERSVAEVIGGIIYMSQELQEIDKILLNSTRNKHIDEFRFIAIHMFEANCDLENSRWHGVNIFVTAKNVNITKKCKWNLSGFSSNENHQKAKNSNINVNDGMDGVDGHSGESSGNVMIIADEIQNSEWLTVILNGGNGANGQDGGDGMNGKDGQGISVNELNEKFPSPVHFWKRFHDLGAIYKKICSMGKPLIPWTKDKNSYVHLRLANGQEIIHSASRYIASNCYLLYKGSPGQVGGRGGLKGLGGEGGYQGECTITLKENKLFSGKIETIKGADGQDGKSGQNGEYGKNGWDVGYVDFEGWSNISEYGRDQKQRLRMDYSTDSSNRVYCGYQYDERGLSMCYATIKASELQHRKLSVSEKSRETCTRQRRQQQAVATRKSAMQKTVMMKLYDQYFENGDHLVNGIAQMKADATINFDIMLKARKAFEELDKLKERSCEKVSRYQVYETKKTRRIAAADATIANEMNPQQRKSQILTGIKNNKHADDNIWEKLFTEEFLEDELTEVEEHFQMYVTNRLIVTPEIRRMQQKFGLAKLQNQLKNDYLPPNTNELDQYCSLNIEKYLKIREESKSDLQQIVQYQQETERIEDVFNELLQYRISTNDFDIVKTYYKKFISVKITVQSLEDFLENVDEKDRQAFARKTEELLKFKLNPNQWNKFLRLLESLKKSVEQTEYLSHLIPICLEEVPINNEKLLKYLLDLHKQIRSTSIANCTLANLVELFTIEHQESQQNSSRIQECLELHKNFLENKQKSIKKINQTVRSISQRQTKASGLCHSKYSNFLANKTIEQVSNMDKKLLQKLNDVYLITQNKCMNWHQQIDDDMLNMCLNKMKSDKNICASLFELIGWKHQLNIKIYCQEDSRQFTCIQEHYTFSKEVLRILIREDQTMECLTINQEFVTLVNARNNLILKFKSERQDKRYFPFDNNESLNDDIIIDKLCKFFSDNIQNKLENRLKKLTEQFIGKNSILSSLLYCFMCNGCHINLNEIFVLINTILDCFVQFDQDPELFSYLILSYQQSELMNEVILIKLENLLRKRFQNKSELRDRLKNIKNHSIKILLARKLEEPELIINEELFSSILTLLPFIKDNVMLEELNLSEWPVILKNSYWQHGLTQDKLNFTDDDLEQCSFYLVKLENSYDRELVQNLVNVLNDAKVLSTKTLLTFVHRFYAGDTELCLDVLDDFGGLNSNLFDLFDPNSDEKYTGEEILHFCKSKLVNSNKQLSHIESLMKKLGLLASEDRNIETLIDIIQKTPQHDNITDHLLKIGDTLKKIEHEENPILKYVIDSYNRQYALYDIVDFRPAKLMYDTFCNDERSLEKIVQIIRSEITMIKKIENYHFYMLDIVNRGIKLKRCFSLRATQKLVVLLALINKKNLLTQVATGEGKTLIIATLCIIKCLYGEKLDIVTSCSVLAKRDAESEPPKANIDLYKLFGVRIGHICSEDIDQRIQVFNNCDVIYGDLSSFQRDYLLDRFYGKNILGRRIFENVVVDEVDSMLLDNGNNMLYLSHDIPNMDKLQSLFVYLWQSVNRPINSLEDLKYFYDNSSIKTSVIADFYGMILQDEVEDDVWKILIESKTIDEDGRLLKYFKDYTQFVKQFQCLKQNTEDRLIFLLNNIASRQRSIKIPEDFYEFVERHLDKFIDNAKHALFMSEGVDYVIDVDRTGLDPDLNPKIIIVDKNTGTDQSSSQWHEGLHQFLQIKHGCKLSLMSLKAVFISNVSYLKLYQNLYGLSGTLGSIQEKALLNELYAVDSIKIPTSKPKHFFEERAVIAGYKEHWINNIYSETKKKLLQRRSVLIIGETVKDVDYITKHLIRLATEQEKPDTDNQLYENMKNPYVYKREHENFVFGQGNEYLSCSKVIIATNLAGRGTDIKLEPELIQAGGLHVILTFLPTNCRVEEQAYGRAGRCGEEGSGQLIVIGTDEDGGSYSLKIFQLKNIRDACELQRLKSVKKFYDERITIEEDCFKQFKERYENLRRKMEICNNTKNIIKIVLDSFLDKWAFWLDANSYLIEAQAIDSSKKKLLTDTLKNFLPPIPLQFDHWLDSPSHFLKLANYNIKNNKYDKAQEYLGKIIKNHPYYLAEALYYSSAIIIKKERTALLDKTGENFEKLKQNLVKAKQLFDERINDCTNDQAIVQAFKKKETNNLIHIEAFSEQQQTISRIYNLFINSIDDILGHPVSYNAFANYELNEILAYDIFNELQNQNILTQLKNTQVILDDTLRDIALEYGISETVLENLHKQLQENTTITSQSISQIVSLPNIEEFWIILKEKKILINEFEFIIINKQKLQLIQSSSIQTSVEKNTIKMELNKLPSTEIFQYPVPNEDDNIFCSIMFYKNLKQQDILYLENRGVCSINRKATINPHAIKEEQKFSKFDSITLSNLLNVNISSDEGIMILEKLSDTNVSVLKEINNGIYKLISDINCTSLPLCYQEVIASILNSTFAYRLAYKHLQEYFNEIQQNVKSELNIKFHFRLISNPYQRLIYDLIDKSIIEDIHVDYEKLKSANVESILCNFTSNYAKHVDRVKKKENFEYINKVLNQLTCGIDKLETPDCFFSSLEGTLKAQQNSAIIEASWFSLNGMEDLIVLQEQTYSWKFWGNAAIVTCMALAQITVGAVIEIFTVGIGTYAASFCISEGVSDLFFVASSLYSGYMTMSSYWEHKIWSMAISAVTCGVGALWSRGTKLSRIGYKVAGPVRKEGGKKVAEMVGRQLAQSVGTGTIVKETMKRVGCKLVEGVAYGFAQGAVDHIITNHLHGVCDAIQKTIVTDVDELFRNHDLNDTILQAFDTLGENQTNLLMDHVTRECFEKTSIYRTIQAHCTRLYGTISRGLSESMQKMAKAGGTTSASKLTTIFLNLMPLLKLYGIYDEISKIRDSAATFLKNANETIQDAFNKHEPSTISKTTSISSKQTIKIIRDQRMQQWKQTIIETSNQVIATHVISPVLSYGVNYLVGYIGNSIKKQYRSYKENEYREKFELLKKDFDKNVKNAKLNAEEHKREVKTYHKALVKLLGKTRDAKLFASILRENIPMDMTCVQACTNVLAQCMCCLNTADKKNKFTGIRIIVEGSDGSSHKYSSSTNPSHTISLTLDDNHFHASGHGNIAASQNNCLYEALISQIPELKTQYPNGKVFRQYLSNYIETDKNLQYTISQGWHKFAIKKGSYGGMTTTSTFNVPSYNCLVPDSQLDNLSNRNTNDDRPVDDLPSDNVANGINAENKRVDTHLSENTNKNECELEKEPDKTVVKCPNDGFPAENVSCETTSEDTSQRTTSTVRLLNDQNSVQDTDRLTSTEHDTTLNPLLTQPKQSHDNSYINENVNDIPADSNSQLTRTYMSYNRNDSPIPAIMNSPKSKTDHNSCLLNNSNSASIETNPFIDITSFTLQTNAIVESPNQYYEPETRTVETYPSVDSLPISSGSIVPNFNNQQSQCQGLSTHIFSLSQIEAMHSRQNLHSDNRSTNSSYVFSPSPRYQQNNRYTQLDSHTKNKREPLKENINSYQPAPREFSRDDIHGPVTRYWLEESEIRCEESGVRDHGPKVCRNSKWKNIDSYIEETNKLCSNIESKIEKKEINTFDDVERYSHKLLEQVARLASIPLPDLPPSSPSSSSSSSSSSGDDDDSHSLKKFFEHLRATRRIVRTGKNLLDNLVVKAVVCIYPPAAPILLGLHTILGSVDAILTIIIGSHDIIYQNGSIWDNLLDITSATLEIIPLLKVPNAEKIKDIGQKGCESVKAFRTMVQPIKNPTAEELDKKAQEIFSFFKALTELTKEIAKTFT